MQFDPDVEQLCRLGDYASALATLDPAHPARGEILYWSGHPEARSWLRAQAGSQARLAEARCCWQADLYEEGLALLKEIPDEAEARVTRALIRLCQAGEEPGQQMLADCWAELPDHRRLRACHDLGVSYQFLGRLEPATDYYQRAAAGWREISPQHPELANALFGLSGVQEKLGDPGLRQSAQEFLQLVPWEDSRWPAVAEALAVVELKNENWPALEPLLEQLWQRAPRASIAYMLAITLSNLDKLAAALARMEQAREGFRAEGRPDQVERCQRNIDTLLKQIG